VEKGLARLVHLRQLLQMLPVDRLAQHFKNACNGQVYQITQLVRDRPYPVVAARRVTATYGHTVMFTLRTEGDILIRIYLPRRYATNIDEDDIHDINQGRKQYKLVYLGMAGPAYLLNIFL